MFIAVKNTPLKKQTYKTSCWISAAHYVLSFLGINDSPALRVLEDENYRPDQNSALQMTGAGKPDELLEKYTNREEYIVEKIKIRKQTDQVIIEKITESLKQGIPVIAGIRSQQIHGFGHAIVIVAINPDTKTLAFKDPSNINGSNPFASDIRIQTYDQFKNGFSYKYANSLQLNVYAYCSQIIVVHRKKALEPSAQPSL